MSATNFIPPLRIEIRRKESADTLAGAWSLLDTAQTDAQAEDKIRRQALPDDAETRIVPNTAAKEEVFSAPAVIAHDEQVAREQPVCIADLLGVGDVLRDIHTGVAVRVTRLAGTFKSGRAREGFAWENLATNPGDPDHTGFCPRESIACFVKVSKKDAAEIFNLYTVRTGEKPREILPPPPPIDALAGQTPLPFGVGDTLRDVHTGVAVRVTGINGTFRSGKPRAGFAWENLSTTPGDKDHTGFCPLESVGCFAKVADDAKPIARPTHKETASPVINSSATATMTAGNLSAVTMASTTTSGVSADTRAKPRKARASRAKRNSPLKTDDGAAPAATPAPADKPAPETRAKRAHKKATAPHAKRASRKKK